MKNAYVVEFDTKMGGDRHWKIDITAKNAKEARAIAEEAWYANHKAHMFHINVRRIPGEIQFLYHAFRLVH